MFIFKCSATHFILVSLFGLLSFASEADPVFGDSACTEGTYFQFNSEFQYNLNSLLNSLAFNASHHDFYRIPGDVGNPNFVRGLFLCRGDVTPTLCQECVTAAAIEITRACPNHSESVIWYDECMLRYSNNSFMNNIVPSIWFKDDKNVSDSDHDRFSQLLSSTLNELVEKASNSSSDKKFATKEAEFTRSQKLYSLAQCIPDLSRFDCMMCFQSAISSVPIFEGKQLKQGARALLPGCTVRYELYPFYNISALSTQSEHPPPSSGKGKENRKSESLTIFMVMVPALVLLMLFCFGCYFFQRRKRRTSKAILRENFGTESTALESLQFDFATIEAATNKFSHENKIGKGGFGEVYKGILHDRREIAVKRLSRNSGQGVVQFKNEILLIAKLQHRNLVALLGFCLEEQEKILVYEYVPNNSLDYFLFGLHKRRVLNWFERYKIIEGIARGILYLHEYSRLKVIHRDLKPSNILLDNNMNPKISDFGMARMVAIEETQGSTNRIVGTFGYMSPEYAMLGQFSEKSDVFSFGVVILEIISGKKNANSCESQYVDGLLSYAWKRLRDENPLELLDPNLTEVCPHIEVIKCIQIGLLCVQENPDARPPMATVVSYLSNHSIQLPFPQEPAFFLHGRIVPTIEATESSLVQYANNTLPTSINDVSLSTFFPR